MRWNRWLAVCSIVGAIWMVPTPAFAESDVSESDGTEQAEESSGASAGSSETRTRPSPWPRRFAEFGGGLGGFYTGALVGGALGIGVKYVSNGGNYELAARPDLVTSLFVIAGATFGAPGGTALLGKPFGAEGTYGGALSGAFVGSLGGVWVGSNLEGTQLYTIFVPLWGVATALGSTVGYEVVHARRTSWMSRVRPSPVSTMTPGARSFGFTIEF